MSGWVYQPLLPAAAQQLAGGPIAASITESATAADSQDATQLIPFKSIVMAPPISAGWNKP